MARKVTYMMKSVADATATFSSVADCKEKLTIPAHADLVNVLSKKTKDDEWSIDGDGNVLRACFYASEDDYNAQKTAYKAKLTELGVTRKYYMDTISAEDV